VSLQRGNLRQHLSALHGHVIDLIDAGLKGHQLVTVTAAVTIDVTISNITMRGVQTPIFLRLGARMRGPADPHYPSTIAGIPGHNIEDVQISNVCHYLVGGLTPADAVQNPPELETAYPENTMFGTLPAFGFYIRHATGIVLDNVAVRFEGKDTRPAFVLDDVSQAEPVSRGRPRNPLWSSVAQPGGLLYAAARQPPCRLRRVDSVPGYGC
jgi:hypothetical protein